MFKDIAEWGQWSEWSECSQSCRPGGLRFRNTTCTGGPNTPPVCLHPYIPSQYQTYLNESESCNVDKNCTGNISYL